MSNPIPTAFTNPDTAKNYEYTGSWESNGRPKGIAWMGVYSGKIADMSPEVVEKMIASGDKRFKKVEKKQKDAPQP